MSQAGAARAPRLVFYPPTIRRTLLVGLLRTPVSIGRDTATISGGVQRELPSARNNMRIGLHAPNAAFANEALRLQIFRGRRTHRLPLAHINIAPSKARLLSPLSQGRRGRRRGSSIPGELIPSALVWHAPGITPCCKSPDPLQGKQLSNPASVLFAFILRGLFLETKLRIRVQRSLMQQYRTLSGSWPSW